MTNTHLELTDDRILELTTNVSKWSDDELRILGDRLSPRLAEKNGEWNIERGPRSATARFRYNCNRCGGSGLWRVQFYTGVCFACGGSKYRNAKISLSAIVRDETHRIKNERDGKGRVTNKELQKEAKRLAEVATHKSRLVAAGVDLERYTAANEWFLANCAVYHHCPNSPAESKDNPNYNKALAKLTKSLHDTATDIAGKAWRFNLSAKQGELIMKYVETCENAEQTVAERLEVAKTQEVPSGSPATIEGEIFWLQKYDGDWGPTTKIGIRVESGAAMFGTLAKGISDAKKGDVVRLTAKAWKTDEGKGKFQRPRNAEIVRRGEGGDA